MTKPALDIRDLSLRIDGAEILSEVALSLAPGEITGLVGRSGSGKSMTALAAMGLAPARAEVFGEVLLNGENLLEKSDAEMCAVRGGAVGMIFQEPMTALNPLQTIGAQVAETIFLHSDLPKAAAEKQAAEALRRAGLPPEEVSPSRYPHELSGGQRQRVVIAIAIAMQPKVLIADEPTTALDVTTQAEILALLKRLAREDGMALLMITHDLAVMSSMADRIAVMKDGRILETASADAFFSDSLHNAANGLAAQPVRRKRRETAAAPRVLLEADHVSCDYALREKPMFSPAATFRAVDSVSFTVREGENVALVGESGSGKSTLGRALLGLHAVSGGRVRLDGEVFPSTDRKTLRRLRRKIQIVFQDPYSSFNPRQTVGRIIAEPFHLFDAPPDQAETETRVADVLTAVGLSPDDMAKRPHAFSGGQRQRIAIARALVTEPTLIVLDEATSALDVVSRNRILDLLMRLAEERGVSYLFITHDLTVVRDVADRVMVMKSGRIVEENETAALFEAPREAYTRQLIAAAPVMRRGRRASA